MKPEDAWQATVGEIEISAGRGNYLTWLQSARFVSYEDGQFIIGVTNGYVKDWMEHRMASALKKALGDRMGRSVEVSVALLT